MFKVRQHEFKLKAQERQDAERIDIAVDNAPLPCNVDAANSWLTLPQKFEQDYNDIYNFDVRSDDVFLVTFPKSGTTWLQEAAWLLLNNLNYAAANSERLTKRSIYLEFASINNNCNIKPLELAGNMMSPRLIKTHLSASLLPHQVWTKKIKIIYCARNPLDVVGSYYPFHRSVGGWNGTIDEFVQDFINGDLIYTPYWRHIMDFWQMRKQNSQLFFTTYEAMKVNLKNVLEELCTFLELPTLNEIEMNKLVEHLSFNSMKKNKQTNPTAEIKHTNLSNPQFEFMRSGIVGSYKNDLSLESQEALRGWSKEMLKPYNATLDDIFGIF